MKSYYFAWLDNVDKQLTITPGEETNIDVVNEIENMVATLGQFLSDQFYYGMLCKNFKELLDIIKKYEKSSESFKYSHEYVPYINEINRFMINSLGSVFTYLNHYEYMLKKAGKKEGIENFKAISSKYFDTHFIYRFFYKLRNYVVHCQIPITCLEASVKNPNKTFYFDSHKLLKSFDWGKIVEADLKNGAKKYCVKNLVLQALSVYREFHLEMISDQIKNVIIVMKQLKKFSRIKNSQQQFPMFLVIDEDNPDSPIIQSMITDSYILADKALKELSIDFN